MFKAGVNLLKTKGTRWTDLKLAAMRQLVEKTFAECYYNHQYSKNHTVFEGKFPKCQGVTIKCIIQRYFKQN